MSGCVMCGKQRIKHHIAGAGEFWGLSNYFGLSGTFCVTCYSKVSHDSYGRPEHPVMHRLAVVKQNKEREKCTQSE